MSQTCDNISNTFSDSDDDKSQLMSLSTSLFSRCMLHDANFVANFSDVQDKLLMVSLFSDMATHVANDVASLVTSHMMLLTSSLISDFQETHRYIGRENAITIFSTNMFNCSSEPKWLFIQTNNTTYLEYPHFNLKVWSNF